MKDHPPSTILEFLEGLGIRLALDIYGNVSELYPREYAHLAPKVKSSLPIIKAELERRALLARRRKTADRPVELGPRLNQVRVENLFRGMNRVEAFVGNGEWIELGWTRRERDGRRFAQQTLQRLLAGPEPAAEKRKSLSKD